MTTTCLILSWSALSLAVLIGDCGRFGAAVGAAVGLGWVAVGTAVAAFAGSGCHAVGASFDLAWVELNAGVGAFVGGGWGAFSGAAGASFGLSGMAFGALDETLVEAGCAASGDTTGAAVDAGDAVPTGAGTEDAQAASKVSAIRHATPRTNFSTSRFQPCASIIDMIARK